MSVFEQPLKTSESTEKQDIFSRLLDTMRSVITPNRGICAASDLLFKYYNCQGALLKSVVTNDGRTISDKKPDLFYNPYKSAPILTGLMDQALFQHLSAPSMPEEDIFTFQVDGVNVLVCYQTLRQHERVLLLLWRKSPWQKAEKKNIIYFWKIAALLMETEHLYVTAINRTRHDPGTGVLTWPALRQTVIRRFPRLDRNGLSSTLILVQINGLSSLASTYGPEMEERILMYCVSVLEHSIRPTDLIGRIGGPLFVLWLDGADRYAAAERAENITQKGIVPPFLKETTLSLQMGLCCREPLSHDSGDELLEQATLALKKTTSDQHSGRRWHYAHLTA